jgi:hypothetical protein
LWRPRPGAIFKLLACWALRNIDVLKARPTWLLGARLGFPPKIIRQWFMEWWFCHGWNAICIIHDIIWIYLYDICIYKYMIYIYICIDIFHWSFHVTGWNAAIGFGPSSTTQFDQSETLGLFAAWILHHFPRFFSEHPSWKLMMIIKFPQNHQFFWILHHNWWYLIIAGMIKFQESENDNWWKVENWINWIEVPSTVKGTLETSDF